MTYDAAGAVELLRRPTVILHRTGFFWTLLRIFGFDIPPKKYVGRVLSHVEWQTFAPRISKADEENAEEGLELARDYCEAIGIPWRKMAELPQGVLDAALTDFFRCQGIANRAATLSPMNPTSGSNLQEPDKSG